MKPDVRKRVRRYGIPIDLVILATGFAMLFQNISVTVLLGLYLFAVVVSALKFGWRSGATAMVFALVVILAGFGATVTAGATAAFLFLSLGAIGAGEVRRRPRIAPAPVLVEEPVAASAPEPAPIKPVVEEAPRAPAPPSEPKPQARRRRRRNEERQRLRVEKEALEKRLEEERLTVERRLAENRKLVEQQIEEERRAAERAAEEKLAAEREAHAKRIEEERRAAARAAEEKLAAERAAAERLAASEREKQELAKRLEAEKERARREAEKVAEEKLAAERAALQKKEAELEKAKAAVDEKRAPRANVVREKGAGLFSSLATWLKTPQRSVPAPKPKKFNGNSTAPRRPPSSPAAHPRPQTTSSRERPPRILMLERRRGTAEVVAPRLREIGVEVQIVERWIDAVDEIFRFRPDVIFVDSELPDIARVHQSILDQSSRLPIVLTASSHAAVPTLPRAASIVRPYTADAIAKLAREAMATPQIFLERQMVRAAPVAAPPKPAPPKLPAVVPAPPPSEDVPQPAAADRYDAVCFNCRIAFDATEADWCSCLTKERTLVCTNCLTCFCKAPPSYKEKFWLDAPARLFERKSAEAHRELGSMGENPPIEQVKRPLVMLVEDDEDIRAIVHRVCTNLGYGFVSAPNGQEGLTTARHYRPNLILSDAFMPKLDGREMCRILKEESFLPDSKMIVMTGLYTDTKYKNEALKRFHIDDYLAKPVSITDLINLLQRHLEGAAPAPQEEDLHELHRRKIEEAAVEEFEDEEHSIPLADLLHAPEEARLPIAASEKRSQAKNYEVCCFTCDKMFDATTAEWCTCLGRDQTLVCKHCGNCFCKAPAAYKERFWIDAPSTLFERKMIGSKRSLGGRNNPSPMEVKRPLILLVEDDENVQLIVKTVVTTLGYGFITAANGQEGLAMAREYSPDLILSDAFMPKLDGREMCRLLKEDPTTARAKAIIMTGLYTDRKYRNEALSYFKVDDYVAKPVAVDDLIKLMKKHLPQETQPTM